MRLSLLPILLLSWFLSGAQAAETPVKSPAPTITVYQDPG